MHIRKFNLLALGVLTASAGGANAQVAGAGGPLPGAGDSTKITSENRDAQATYNERMGSGDFKSKNADRVEKKKAPVPASAADIQAGAVLRAVDGPQIGTVESLNAGQVVVNTGESKIAVPLIGFGKDDSGLVLNMTAVKFKDAVAKAHAAHASAESN